MDFFDRERHVSHAIVNTPTKVEAGYELSLFTPEPQVRASFPREGGINLKAVVPRGPRAPIMPFVEPDTHKRLYGRADPQAAMPAMPTVAPRFRR